mgnify:CR=1 FL=1
MDYNNLLKRSFISFLFVFIYIFVSLYKFEYIFLLILLIYLLISLEVFINFLKLKLVIFLYLIISLFFLLNIDFNQYNYAKFNLMVVVIISFDIFCYLTGKTMGKNKISKTISPNKTYEGLIGGIIFSLLISLLYSYYINLKFSVFLLFFILLIILSSFTGDMIESYFKRQNNIKNSSNYLPGHGGFFDRFDSFIVSIVTYYFIVDLL